MRLWRWVHALSQAARPCCITPSYTEAGICCCAASRAQPADSQCTSCLQHTFVEPSLQSNGHASRPDASPVSARHVPPSQAGPAAHDASSACARRT